jgi:hypothetical protein
MRRGAPTQARPHLSNGRPRGISGPCMVSARAVAAGPRCLRRIEVSALDQRRERQEGRVERKQRSLVGQALARLVVRPGPGRCR